MASPKTVTPAVSWTYKLNSEEKQEHEFSNLVQELVYAVQRDDGAITKYCVCELRRMFRERR